MPFGLRWQAQRDTALDCAGLHMPEKRRRRVGPLFHALPTLHRRRQWRLKDVQTPVADDTTALQQDPLERAIKSPLDPGPGSQKGTSFRFLFGLLCGMLLCLVALIPPA